MAAKKVKLRVVADGIRVGNKWWHNGQEFTVTEKKARQPAQEWAGGQGMRREAKLKEKARAERREAKRARRRARQQAKRDKSTTVDLDVAAA